MTRILLFSLTLLMGVAAVLFFGLLRPAEVYAFAPTTTVGPGPMVMVLGREMVLVSSDDSESACSPVHSITVEQGTPLVLDADALDGPIASATICDLDADGNLELALSAKSCGSGGYASFLLLERENNTWIERSRGALTGAPTGGYMGHDKIAVTEHAVIHSYPLFAPGDSNSSSSGGKRICEYRLEGDKLTFYTFVESRNK